MSMPSGPPMPKLRMWRFQVVMASSLFSYMNVSLIIAMNPVMNHVLHETANALVSASGEAC